MTKKIDTLADLTPDGENFNKHTEFGQKLLEDSLRKFGAGRSILVDKDGNIIAGNSTTETAAAIGMEDVIVVPTDGKKLVVVQRTDLSLDSPEGRELALADNMTALKGIDIDLAKVQETLGDDLAKAWGMNLTPPELPDDEEIRRKEAEFQQRMEAGEDMIEDEDYLEFLDKFKAKNKKTTDDCYTPAIVYDAVAKWVENEYKVSRKEFVRPFYPGGDYKSEKYPKGCIVVDNPPFSILAEILNFYKDNGVLFFLFAPTLTLFSISSSSTALPCNITVTYENGAKVNTSFLTNLEDRAIRFKSCPSLYKAVQAASDEYAKKLHKEVPRYSYPDYVVTAAFVARLSKYGIPFEVSVGQSCAISALDSQKDTKKAIYGKGYLVSEKAAAEKAAAEKAAAEKAAAEKAAAEKAAATRWTLSDRERAIIAKLSKNDKV